MEALAHNLKDQGYIVFLDIWELIPGQRFPSALHDGLERSKAAILVATPDAAESSWVQDEYETMLARRNDEQEFVFIPIVLGEFPHFPFLKTTHAVDFNDGGDASYRQAFARLLSGLQGQAPGDQPHFDGPLQIPTTPRAQPVDPTSNGKPFSEQVLDAFVQRVPIMLLAQADARSDLLTTSLRERAKARYGPDRVFHLYPPTSSQADGPAYFGRLAKQLGEDLRPGHSWDWAELLVDKLQAGSELFLLISGLENGSDELREELAGVLRQPHETHSDRIHICLLGGERLAALKFARGELSLLNIADPQLLPEPDAELLRAILPNGQDWPWDDQQLEQVLAFTGGHPRLIQFCLKQREVEPDRCEQRLRASPLPSQLFNHFQDPEDRAELVELLAKPDLGRADFWPDKPLLRRLLWQNLIKHQAGRLIWRGDFIRQIGLESVS